MTRSTQQRMYLVAAVLLGAAPLAFGLVRAFTTRTDLRMVWMALAASIFAFGVLAAAIGRRRTRHAMWVQAIVILIVSALLAGGTGFVLGARAGPGVWAVALVLSICLAASSVMLEFSRPTE